MKEVGNKLMCAFERVYSFVVLNDGLQFLTLDRDKKMKTKDALFGVVSYRGV